jgi:iron complex outermembrane recepter protein
MLESSTVSKIIQISFFIFLCGYSSAALSNDDSNSIDDLFALSLADLLKIQVITGTRAQSRTLSNSTVAIDIYDAEDFKLSGSGDLTEQLKYLIPAYNATVRNGDGAAFVRSTTLRGLPPDDVLLLVNSKRRHRSALIQHGGPSSTAGAQAADPGPIPAIALKRLEVLRDGAASQYGSDAIAGVLNFILKDSDSEGDFEAQYGEYYQGERTLKVAFNKGFSITENSFVNVSAEYIDYEQLIRGVQPASAQNAIDAGVVGVGADSPYAGDKLAQTWGRPETNGLRTAWNIGYIVDANNQLYSFGNYADYYGNFRFFYRPSDNASLQQMPVDPIDPSSGNFCWCDALPAGYTPYLEANITDFSNSFGLRGQYANSTSYDFSVSVGLNKIQYLLNNTLNPSFGPNSPRDFDIGDLTQQELNLNADFSKPLNDKLNFAYGFEWREETYIMDDAQLEAWAAGPWADVGQLIDPVTKQFYTAPPIGSNGLSGTTADAAGRFRRDNYAIYTDVEWRLGEKSLMQSAIRYEKFSDFGSTINGKIAARYKLSSKTTLRGTLSSGFRAPTPGQSNYTGIRTNFDGTRGMQTQDGTILPTSKLAVSLGGKALDPEISKNISLGLTSNWQENFNISFDFYWIELKNRIAKTIDIPAVDPLFTRASFYTNALTSNTKGVDVVGQYVFNWENGAISQLRFAYNYNHTKITKQNHINGVHPVADITIFNIENSMPKNRFNLTLTHNFTDNWQIKMRANYFGETIDERIEHEIVSAATFVDVELNYQASKHLQWTLGASNLFNAFPTQINTRVANGLLYPKRSPLSYDGGMAYLRLTYRLTTE